MVDAADKVQSSICPGGCVRGEVCRAQFEGDAHWYLAVYTVQCSIDTSGVSHVSNNISTKGQRNVS